MKYYVFNRTDGIPAYPEPVTADEGITLMAEFRQRFLKQGYYASVRGRIAVEDLELELIPAEEEEE